MKKRDVNKSNNKNELLFDIWEYIDLKNTKSSFDESQYVKEAEEYETKLLITLNKEEKILFACYNDSLSELNYLSRRNAFVLGIKFATEYLLEVLYNN